MSHRKGWFRIPGVQDGDRTIEMQLKGLKWALDEARGKTVLDLGCAEGLISCEFAKAGAKSVLGYEIVYEHVKVAQGLAAVLPHGVEHPRFLHGDVAQVAAQGLAAPEGVWQYDIVLALAILHKLREPKPAVRYVIEATRDLAVVRTAGATPGYISDPRSGNRVYPVKAAFLANGFVLERETQGHYNEWMGYFRRKEKK